MPQKLEEKALAHLQACIPIHALSREEARVAVAKDVIAAIAAERIKLNSVYFSGRTPKPAKRTERVSLRELLPEASPPTVCGIGAVFVAYVGRWNAFSVLRQGGNSCFGPDKMDMVSALSDFFTREELSWIETGFGDASYNFYYNEAFYIPASRNGLLPPSVFQRHALTAMMRFIIASEGAPLPENPREGVWFKTPEGQQFKKTGRVRIRL